MPKAERERVVDEKLELVGLDAAGPTSTRHELSGGMQQRVGLARAFATDAPILLMDEPFSALDPLIRDKLQDELLELQQQLKQDHRLRQPRSRRGAEDRQPHRHHGRRAHRPVRHAAGHRAAARPTTTSREFVAHMNPLNVLTACDVMREPARPRARRRRLGVARPAPHDASEAGTPTGRSPLPRATDRDAESVMFDGAGSLLGNGSHVVFAARRRRPCAPSCWRCRRNAAPVALFDSEERLVGSIGVRDVLQAILRTAATATKWTPDGADVAFFRLDKLTSLSTARAQGNERLFGFISRAVTTTTRCWRGGKGVGDACNILDRGLGWPTLPGFA